MTSPHFSVVIPAYNSERTVLGAVRSVLAQTETDFEVLVIDDGSSDNTYSVVQAIDDPRVRCVHTDNRGVSGARNLGIGQSRGEVVTFLDSDDVAYRNWLSTLADLLAVGSVGMAFCAMDQLAPNGTITQRSPTDDEGIFGSAPCLFLAGTYAVRRTLLEQVGGFDERLRYSENTELGIRLVAASTAMGFKTAATSDPLVRYKTRSRDMDSRRWEARLAAAEFILDKHAQVFRRDPSTLANWLGLAGVTAAKLGRWRQSRVYFLRAIAFRPWLARSYGRLAVALSPQLAQRIWGSAIRVETGTRLLTMATNNVHLDTVLFVSFWPYLGGAQMSLLTILGALPAGISAVLACPPVGPLPQRAAQGTRSVEILALPLGATGRPGWGTRLKWSWSLARWIESNRSRLLAVHANGDAELKLVVPSLLVLRRPVVVWLHAKLLSPSTARLSPLWRLLERRILWAPVSSWLRGEGLRHHLFTEKNSAVIPNPIGPDGILSPYRDRVRSEPMVVGYLGGEVEDKGILTVAAVAEKMQDDPVRFHVVTKGWDRDRNSARVNDALDRLRALPHTVEMRPWSREGSPYRDMDVLLVPSQAESFCRIAAEAMLNGIPVVASRLPAILEVVGDGEAGLLFPVDGARAAAGALRQLMDDPALIQALGDEGRRKARQYSPETVMAQLVAAYESPFPLVGAMNAALRPDPAQNAKAPETPRSHSGTYGAGAQPARFKILHVIDGLTESGGSEKQLVRNLQFFSDQRLRHDVAHLYPRVGKDRISQIPKSVVVIGLSRPGETDLSRPELIRRLSALVRHVRPDLIHCSLANASLAARIAGRRHGIPVVESLVSMSYEPLRIASNPAARPWKFRAYRWVDRLTMANVTKFHAVSGAAAQSWAHHVGLPPSKICVIPRGLDLAALNREIEGSPSREEVLRSLGLPVDSFLIMNVGRQDAQKGQIYALRAMARIVESVPAAVLAIAGTTGNATPRLLQTIAELHLEDRVLLLGHRSDVTQLLSAADVFLFPSLFEGMPGALLEAMACGLPCVAFALPPMGEVISGGVTGLLTEPRSPVGLADAVSLLAGDSDMRRRLGSAARQMVESKYSAAEAARALEELYLEVLEAR